MSTQFEDWLHEREGFSLRSERLFADVGSNFKRYELVVEWLRAAYLVGRSEGDQISDLKNERKD